MYIYQQLSRFQYYQDRAGPKVVRNGRGAARQKGRERRRPAPTMKCNEKNEVKQAKQSDQLNGGFEAT